MVEIVWRSTDESLNPLTALEIRMLEHAAAGTKFDLGTTPNDITDDNRIRARVIERLLRGQEDWRLAGRGLWLEGAGIEGVLDLEGLRRPDGSPAPALNLGWCFFDAPPIFAGAALDALTLNSAAVPRLDGTALQLTRFLDANDLTASGPVALDHIAALRVSLDRLQPPEGATTSVSLRSARIAAQLFLNSARLESKFHALFLDDAVIGAVFLNRAICSGEVRALGAKISGQWNANGAQFVNPTGDALALYSAEIGSVFLDGSNFTGEVRANGATVRGQWSAIGATFDNSGGDALNLDSSTIAGGLFLRDDADIVAGRPFHRATQIDGCLNLTAATINGLSLDGVRITAPAIGTRAGIAIRARDLIVNGAVFIGSSPSGRRPVINGTIYLPGATVSGRLGLWGLDLTASTSPGIVLGQRGTAIDLRGSTLGGVQVAAAERPPKNFAAVTDGEERDSAGRRWVEASDAGFDTPATITGHVDLGGAMIKGDLDIEAATLVALTPDCPSAGISSAAAADAYTAATALSLHMTQIIGALRVRRLTEPDGTGSAGIVDLRGAACDELDDDDGRGWGVPPDWTDAAARIGAIGLVLDLDGFDYRRFEAAAPPPPLARWHGMPGLIEPIANTAGNAIGVVAGALASFPPALVRWLIGWSPRNAGPEPEPAVDAPLWLRRRHWLERQYRGDRPTAADYAPQPWQHLARVLMAQGKDLDARRITIEHHYFQLRCATDRAVDRAWAYVYGGLAGFGYSPGRALGWALSLATAGIVVISLGFAADAHFAADRAKAAVGESGAAITLAPACSDERRFTATADCPFFVARQDPDKAWLVCSDVAPWLYALDVYLPIDLGQEGRCDVPAQRHMWGILKLLFALIGWVAVPLAALTFTGILRRN